MAQHLHILGICGTFMGGLAVLAKEAGHRVTGCDANVYPPMSTQLEAQGIELIQGYSIAKTLETTEHELMESIFPHPTLSEMMHESVLDAFGRVIHV